MVVTNTADVVPTPTPTPTVPTTPGDDLASTGADVALLAGVSVLFVAIGLTIVAARRRHLAGRE
ncbi:hypothetical protein ACFWGN_01145 [Oerskovia sp. NPDC060338]|uniref:hypothetical protein n=1 Tax=Oerskovia sp. NPDC060338 TaxID=3347100 RepID=UPI00364D67D2